MKKKRGYVVGYSKMKWFCCVVLCVVLSDVIVESV